MRIVHGSTFSGIGAPEVAAEMLGWSNAFHCEINPFGRAVLYYYFPKAESYEDITKTDFSKWRDKITVLTGGFPCQPFSYAGKRRGSEDDRYLWPYMLKCIQEIRPTWFVGENVAGITTMVFPGEDVKVGSGGTLFEETYYMERDERYVIEEICQQLEDIGYSVQPMLIPACAVGAPHRRDRVFFIAHRDEDGKVDVTDTLHKQCDGVLRTAREQRTLRDEPEHRQTIPEEGYRNGVHTDLERTGSSRPSPDPECDRGREVHQPLQSQLTDGAEPISNGRQSDVADTDSRGMERRGDNANQCDKGIERQSAESAFKGNLGDRERYGYLQPEARWRTFPTVSPVYQGNDGLPFDVDNLTIPFSQWKKESLKAYGNAIVVQVMYRIFEAIDKIENTK